MRRKPLRRNGLPIRNLPRPQCQPNQTVDQGNACWHCVQACHQNCKKKKISWSYGFEARLRAVHVMQLPWLEHFTPFTQLTRFYTEMHCTCCGSLVQKEVVAKSTGQLEGFTGHNKLWGPSFRKTLSHINLSSIVWGKSQTVDKCAPCRWSLMLILYRNK